MPLNSGKQKQFSRSVTQIDKQSISNVAGIKS